MDAGSAGEAGRQEGTPPSGAPTGPAAPFGRSSSSSSPGLGAKGGATPQSFDGALRVEWFFSQPYRVKCAPLISACASSGAFVRVCRNSRICSRSCTRRRIAARRRSSPPRRRGCKRTHSHGLYHSQSLHIFFLSFFPSLVVEPMAACNSHFLRMVMKNSGQYKELHLRRGSSGD